MSEHDLVIVTLAGVQRFIAESRTTTDLATASHIVSDLVREAAEELQKPGIDIVFPHPASSVGGEIERGLPNRIVALVPQGTGPREAQTANGRIHQAWGEKVRTVFGGDARPQPGWPLVQWVAVPAGNADYKQQWIQAQRLLANRKNIRDFAQLDDTPGADEDKRELCTLSPRWRSVRTPRQVKELAHLRHETLSAANWVKRLFTRMRGRQQPPSTNGIASAPFRAAVLDRRIDPRIAEAIGNLREAVAYLRDGVGLPEIPETAPQRLANKFSALDGDLAWYQNHGGLWSYPSTWNMEGLSHRLRRETNLESLAKITKKQREDIKIAVDKGREAALRLQAIMAAGAERPKEPDTATLSPHLAILVQDIDSLGRHLSGNATAQNGQRLTANPQGHMEVSRRLSDIARAQSKEVQLRGGHLIYAGGDDLLALVPAANALDVAAECRKAVGDDLPTASTGLLFFHHGFPLQEALVRARELLDEAKSHHGKDRLGIGYVRRSGSNASCVVRWASDPGSIAEALRIFVRPEEHRIQLSPRLLGDVVAEHRQLGHGTSSALPRDVAKKELSRLIYRHTSIAGSQEIRGDARRKKFADEAMAAFDRMTPKHRLISEEAVRVALFLRRENHDDQA